MTVRNALSASEWWERYWTPMSAADYKLHAEIIADFMVQGDGERTPLY